MEEEKPAVPAVSPTGKPMLPQAAVVALTVIAALASSVVGLGASGVELPKAVIAVAAVLSAVCAALGIASPGLRSKPKDPSEGA